MKSIELEYHFQVGISNGLSSPIDRWCSALTFWQVKNLFMYFAISLFILSHHKYCFKSLGCTEYRVLWASNNIFSFSSSLSCNHNWFWNLNVPSSSTTKQAGFPFFRFCLILCSLHPRSDGILFLLIRKVAPLKLTTKHVLTHVKSILHPKRSRSSNTRGCVMIMVFRLC